MKNGVNKMIWNRAPLQPEAFAELPVGAVKPEGWLRRQLEVQAKGLTGRLEDIWKDLGSDSGWLGGEGESWERGPYYCDGLVPLAYILDDENLKEKAQKWIEWTLDSQREDGFFGPSGNEDWWPRMVMLKVLTQYYDATGDERVIPFMTNYFRYQYSMIREKPLFDWGRIRGGDNILTVYWLYNHTGDEFLLDLTHILYEQTTDWTGLFSDFPYKASMKEIAPWDRLKGIPWKEISSNVPEYHQSHVVNLAMALKQPVLYYQQSNHPSHREAARKGIEALMKHHGVVYGMFTGDEHLSGNDPSQGTELCAVVEYMFSLENLIRILGEAEYGDILERLAYNALPATFTPDMMGHQYDQQANQVLCTLAKRNWYNNNDDSNLFGLEPNFGCCTANLHQGWPKFARTLWMAARGGGLAAISYAPCTVDAKVNGDQAVSIRVDSCYPFEGDIHMAFSIDQGTAAFPLKLRIPGWCKNALLMINGKLVPVEANEGFITLNREWKDGDSLELQLDMDIRISRWFHNSAGVERGPLVFGLKIGEEWKKLRGQEECPDWEVYPTTPWNYGLEVDEEHPERSFDIVWKGLTDSAFSPESSPIELAAKGRRIPEWGLEDHSAGTLPPSPISSEEALEEIRLIPYGATNLRIAQFPVLK